jgi:hypothetical protein
MKNKLIAIISAIVIILGGGVAYQFGSGSESSSNRVDIYGTESATTLASTTSNIVVVGTEFNKVNLNIKTSSTAAQTISVYNEYSNDNECDSNSAWFRDTRNAGVLAFSTDGNNFTVATTTFNLAIPAGPAKNTLQIGGNDVGGMLNARCIRINLSTSSTTDPAILWVEGMFSN